MHPYELILIINPELDESETNELIKRVKGIIESSEGQVLKVDEWGMKRLAYPIKRHTDGNYVLYVFESSSGFIHSLNNSLQLIESIIRHMIVRFEGDLDEILSSEEEVVTTPPQKEESEEGTPDDGSEDVKESTSETDDSENGDEDRSDVNETSDEP